MNDLQSMEFENLGKSVTVQCVQYIMSQHMKNKKIIKKDDLMKTTAFKGRIVGKNYDRVMEDVENTLKNVFGFSLSFIDNKKFMVINDIEDINIHGVGSNKLSKYHSLLYPILAMIIMLRTPISEGQLWNILEKYSNHYDLQMDIIKSIVKEDFVKSQYLQYKATDDSTILMDPEKTSYWFSLGPRSLVECDQMMLLQSIGKLYKKPAKSFKHIYAALNK